jgi:hypothetical protein
LNGSVWPLSDECKPPRSRWRADGNFDVDDFVLIGAARGDDDVRVVFEVIAARAC